MDFEDTQKQPTNSEPELTPQLAQEIFEANGTPIQIFNNPGYNFNFRHIKKVYQHGRWLRKTMRQAMSGNYILEPAQPATYDEDGNELTPAVPAVYFEPTTAVAFKTFMEGVYADKAEATNEDVLLDVEAVALQLMDGKTWVQWKASFNE